MLFPGLKKWFAKLGLVLAGVIIGIALFELGHGLLVNPAKPFYCVWPPNHSRVSLIPEKGFPGLQKSARLKINSQGFRAGERPKDAFPVILALGGSTTECLTLNQDKTWPFLLQESLRQTGLPAWVGNAGMSGHNTRDHIFQVRHLLAEHPQTDLVILLVGINDFLLRLERDREYDPGYLKNERHQRRQVRRAFSVHPDSYFSFPKNLKTGQLLQRITLPRFGEPEPPDPVHPFVCWRRARAKAYKIEHLPDLKSGLDEYESNLLTIMAELRKQNKEALFLTQPTLWANNMPEALKKLLWLGYKGGRGSGEYYSAACLAQGMARYNELLSSLCKTKGFPCLNLAALLPKDSTVFYDDCHFNESGAAKVADLVQARLPGLLKKVGQIKTP